MKLRNLFWRLLLLNILVLAPFYLYSQSGSVGKYGVIISEDVMVPMRDGVLLATDIYRPAQNGDHVQGKFPVLLTRTPYGKSGSKGTAAFFAQHGYIVAIQDVRGRYLSEGKFYIYLNEGKDGYDAVEWLADQEWSNGDIGTFGGSYSAATQNALAVENPSNLKTMFITVGTSNYWEDGSGAGGASALLHNLAYAFNLASTSKEAQTNPALQEGLLQGTKADNLGEWMKAYPFRNNASPFNEIPTYQKWVQDFVDHYSYDEYWKQNGFTFESYYDQFPDIPIYFAGGWFDIFLHGTLTNFTELSKKKSSPMKLLVGPWVHGIGPSYSGGVYFGPEAAVDIQQEQLHWFNKILKGDAKSGVNNAPVQLFLMGGADGSKARDDLLNHGGKWVSSETWPPADINSKPFYLQPDGKLSSQSPNSSTSSTTFTYDPSDPVPTIGGKIDSGSQLSEDGPRNQRCIKGIIFGCNDSLPLSARRDVVVYETPPLKEDMAIMGPVTVKLWVSSTAKDTDFTAKLIDVYPPSKDYPLGYDMLLSDRIVRARFRNSLEEEDLLVPGKVYEITIDLLGMANRFKKGHQIRLDISSSNFPFFDANPNTGERPGYHTRVIKAQNTIYHDKKYPSHINLPLIKID